MDITAYLKRIRYSSPVSRDVQSLHGLQRAHLLHVPFENLDIGLKRPIRLEEQALWDKIIIQRRGGFCYELNGLFSRLLAEIGFEVTHLNARVYNRRGTWALTSITWRSWFRSQDIPGAGWQMWASGIRSRSRWTLTVLKSRHKGCGPTGWNGRMAAISPGREITMAPGSAIIISISSGTGSRRSMKPTGNALLGDQGCQTNGLDNFDQIHFWKTPVANCGEGKECVPYHEWVTNYIAVIGGR